MIKENTAATGLSKETAMAVLEKPVIDETNIVTKTNLTKLQETLLKRFASKKIKSDDPKLQEAFKAAALKINPLQNKFEKASVEAVSEMGQIIDDLLKNLDKGVTVKEFWDQADFKISLNTGYNYRRVFLYKEQVLKNREWFLENCPGQDYSLSTAYLAARASLPADKQRSSKKPPTLTTGTTRSATLNSAPTVNALVVLSTNSGLISKLQEHAEEEGAEALGLYVHQVVDPIKASKYFDAVEAFNSTKGT